MVTDQGTQMNLSNAFVLGMLALSMGFLWGYVGILSFGQTVFFGLGGYGYAILSLNWGIQALPALLAVLGTMIFAAIFGYFMIYGRISELYLSILTLVMTLVFEKLIKATSGPQYVIGSVRINGQNGMPGLPGFSGEVFGISLDSITGVYYLSLILLLFCYLMCRLVLITRFGRILVGLRESELRMELFGYDSRFYKLGAFVLAAGIAAVSGVLYAVWGGFVGPELFGLNQAALVVIWVIVGGKALLLGPIVGAGLIQYLTAWLGTIGVGQVTLVLGALLIFFVLLFPNGIVSAAGAVLTRIRKLIGTGNV
jgi:branched-chain amino acid transport system permease protein